MLFNTVSNFALPDGHPITDERAMPKRIAAAASELADPLVFIHALLTGIVMWWSLLIVLGKLRFDIPGSLFAHFGDVMPQTAWSFTFLAVVAFGVLGLFDRRWQIPATHVLSIFHGTIALLIARHGFWSTGTGVYGMLALFSGYLVWVRR